MPLIDRSPDLAALHGAASLGGALAEVVDLASAREVVPGWATVELARAAGAALALRPDGRDDLLGAVAAVVRLDRSQRVVLLEPATEGPLAAALARHGEGWVAAYLLVGPEAPERLRRAGYRLTRESRGPLGPQRRVLVGPRDGPFLLVVSEA